MSCGKTNVALHSDDALAPEGRKFMKGQKTCLFRMLLKACTDYNRTQFHRSKNTLKIVYGTKRMEKPPEPLSAFEPAGLLHSDTKSGHPGDRAPSLFLLLRRFSEPIRNIPSWRKPFRIFRKPSFLFSRPKHSFRLPFT